MESQTREGLQRRSLGNCIHTQPELFPTQCSIFQVVHGDPPQLTPTTNGNCFTIEFINFVNLCLMKDETVRPKYTKLLEQPFILKSEAEPMDTAGYVMGILDRMQGNVPRPENMFHKMDISDKNGS